MQPADFTYLTLAQHLLAAHPERFAPATAPVGRLAAPPPATLPPATLPPATRPQQPPPTATRQLALPLRSTIGR